MSNGRIQQLRELLLRLLRGPVHTMAAMVRGESIAMFEAALPEMVRLRFGGEVPERSEQRKLSTIAVLQQAVAVESAGGGVPWPRDAGESVWETTIGFLRRNKLAVACAAVGTAVAILLFVFGQSWFAVQPDRDVVDDKPAPEIVVPQETFPDELPDLVPEIEDRTAPDEPGLLAVKPLKVGEIVAVVGRPSLAGPGAEDGETALPEMPVYAGMTLETGDADMIEILFEDGSSLAIAYNTRITVIGLPVGSGVPEARRFRQDTGTVWAKVAELEGGATFEIETPVATAVAFGTEFGLELRNVASPDDGEELEAVLTVSSGHVRFENDHGTVDAFAMMESIARSDGRPSEPRRINIVRCVKLAANHTSILSSLSRASWVSARWSLAQTNGAVGLKFGRALASDPLKPAGPDDVWRVQITRVVRGSAPQAAGLKVGDVVLRVDRRPVVTVDDAYLPFYAAPGTEVLLTVSREGVEHTASLTIRPERPGRVPSLAKSEMEKLWAATMIGIEGDYAGSIAALTALTDGPEPAAAHNNLGVLYLVQDELGEAIRHFQAAVKLAPDVGLYRSSLSLALLYIGNYSRAIEEIEAAVALAPDWPRGIYQLSHTYDDAGNHTEALVAAERLVALSPNDPIFFYTLGTQLHYVLRYDESERAYRKVIDLEPDYASGYAGLGGVYYSIGRFAESDELYRTAIRLDPTNAAFLDNLAIHLLARGMYEDAYPLTMIALRLRPDRPKFLKLAGQAQRGRGNLEDAIRLLEKALDFADEDSLRHSIMGQLARAFYRAGDIDEAETMYRKAIKLDPKNAGAHNNFGIFLSNLGRMGEAEAMYRKAIELEPEVAAQYGSLGSLLRKSGRLEEAEAMHRKAIELEPEYAPPYNNLGNLLKFLGRLEEAEAMYRKAIELDSKLFPPYFNLGRLLQDAGRFEEARALFRKATELNPKYAATYYNLGNVLKDLGRLDEAEAMYRKTIELDPKFAAGYGNLGALLSRAGRLDEAEDVTRQWVAALPNDVRASNGLAWVLALQGESLDEALALALRAVEGDPENPGSVDTLGWVHFKRGEHAKAEAALRKAVELYGEKPGAAGSLVRLGQVYEAKGDREAAKDAYRRALSIVQGNKEAAEALKRLGG